MKINMGFLQTTKCIICLKPAKFWTGHVLMSNKKVIAGWCEEHRNSNLPNIANSPGLVGCWLSEMGLESYYCPPKNIKKKSKKVKIPENLRLRT